MQDVRTAYAAHAAQPAGAAVPVDRDRPSRPDDVHRDPQGFESLVCCALPEAGQLEVNTVALKGMEEIPALVLRTSKRRCAENEQDARHAQEASSSRPHHASSTHPRWYGRSVRLTSRLRPHSAR